MVIFHSYVNVYQRVPNPTFSILKWLVGPFFWITSQSKKMPSPCPKPPGFRRVVASPKTFFGWLENWTITQIIDLLGGFKHLLFSIIYGIILPIDFHIFQDGYCTTNQWCIFIQQIVASQLRGKSTGQAHRPCFLKVKRCMINPRSSSNRGNLQ